MVEQRVKFEVYCRPSNPPLDISMQFQLSFLSNCDMFRRKKADAGREISSAFVEVNLSEMCEHLLHNGLGQPAIRRLFQSNNECKTAFMNSMPLFEKEINRTDKKVKIKTRF